MLRVRFNGFRSQLREKNSALIEGVYDVIALANRLGINIRTVFFIIIQINQYPRAGHQINHRDEKRASEFHGGGF